MRAGPGVAEGRATAQPRMREDEHCDISTPGGMLLSTEAKENGVQIDQDILTDVTHRLRRVEGQIGGLVRMIEDGRDCKDVITQLAAASRALDRAGFRILATGLSQCIANPSEEASQDRDDLEKLFLALA